MMLPAYEAFCRHAAQVAPVECCGLIVADEYRPCRNIADLDHFEVHPEDWDAAEDAGTIQAVCHSHPGASACPSASDVASCKQTKLPWFILGQDGMERLDPEPIPLLERPFVYGWSDCYSLVRDYYGNLPDFPREEDFEDKGHSPYTDLFPKHGFRVVPPGEAQVGDLLLMRVASQTISNHAAIYLGAGEIMHHLWGRFSCTELWGPFMNRTTHILRRVR